jgi:hypothetical protein
MKFVEALMWVVIIGIILIVVFVSAGGIRP